MIRLGEFNFPDVVARLTRVYFARFRTCADKSGTEVNCSRKEISADVPRQRRRWGSGGRGFKSPLPDQNQTSPHQQVSRIILTSRSERSESNVASISRLFKTVRLSIPQRLTSLLGMAIHVLAGSVRSPDTAVAVVDRTRHDADARGTTVMPTSLSASHASSRSNRGTATA